MNLHTLKLARWIEYPKSTTGRVVFTATCDPAATKVDLMLRTIEAPVISLISTGVKRDIERLRRER